MPTGTGRTNSGSDGQPNTLVMAAYLNAEIASVDIITEEEISRLGRIAADLEELHKIIVLSMDVATNSDGSIHLQQVRFGLQDLGAALEDPQRLVLCKSAFAVKMLLQKL